MRVNYFDLGLYTAVELDWMVNSILPSIGVLDFRAYGFEANPTIYQKDVQKFKSHDKVEIFNLAICRQNTKINFYLSDNPVSHSIYSTKKNVDANKFIEVQGVVFSDWIKENVPTFKKDFNIIKANIEGAEWDLMNDLNDNDMIKNIQIFCGQFKDVKKVKELRGNLRTYRNFFKENNIRIERFASHRRRKNADMSSIIKEKLKSFGKNSYEK